MHDLQPQSVHVFSTHVTELHNLVQHALTSLLTQIRAFICVGDSGHRDEIIAHLKTPVHIVSTIALN